MNNDQVDRGLGSYSVGGLINISVNRDLISYEVRDSSNYDECFLLRGSFEPYSRFVRVVKEVALRATGEIRVGSNPTACRTPPILFYLNLPNKVHVNDGQDSL